MDMTLVYCGSQCARAQTMAIEFCDRRAQKQQYTLIGGTHADDACLIDDS